MQPLWGWLADRYGRKSMLIRASLGMAVTMSMMGLVQNVWQLTCAALRRGARRRLCNPARSCWSRRRRRGTGRVGHSAPCRSAWLGGSLVGPLVGGLLPDLIGLRQTFFAGGAMIAVAFLATDTLIREQPVVRKPGVARPHAKGRGR